MEKERFIVKQNDAGQVLVIQSPDQKLTLPRAPIIEQVEEEDTLYTIDIMPVKKQSGGNERIAIVSLIPHSIPRLQEPLMFEENLFTKWMSQEEVQENIDKFDITHLRMILHYFNIRKGADIHPKQGRVSNKGVLDRDFY